MPTEVSPARSFGTFSLAAVTAIAMGVATFGQSVYGILASDLITEFGVERWQIGALVTACGVTGALASPLFGRVTDEIGGVRSVRWVLVLGGLAIAVVAGAPGYAVLLAGATLAGLPNGWTNPATNTLIVDNVALGARGVITGIKQSGVQMGAFLGGLVLPNLAAATNWRVAFGSFLVFPLAGLAAMWRRPVTGRQRRTDRSRQSGPIPTVVRWVALYGILTGVGVSSITTFLPLFAKEGKGWSSAEAGLLIAVIGLAGVAARISWGSLSERRFGHGRTLRYLAVLSASSAGLLTLCAQGLAPDWAIGVAALLLGAGGAAWTAVGMLAAMDYSSPGMVGRGTGLIMLGFLTGVGLGPPLMGLSVDRSGTYAPGWLAMTVLFTITIVVAIQVERSGTLASR